MCHNWGHLKKLYVYVFLSFKKLSSIWLYRVSVAAQGNGKWYQHTINGSSVLGFIALKHVIS